MVFQIFGAGELLPKMCEIGFAYTHAYCLLNVQREVRHRQPWRGHDHDRKKAADAIVAAGDPRTIHSLSGARCGGNAPLTLSTGKIPLIVCKGVRTSETTKSKPLALELEKLNQESNLRCAAAAEPR